MYCYVDHSWATQSLSLQNNLTYRTHTIRSHISETYRFNEHMKTWQTAKEVHTKSHVLYNIQVKI